MNEMIERVAKAMFAHAKAAPESDIRERDFSDMQADEQDFAIGLARAAIEAIEKMGFVIVPREPTEAMIHAGSESIDGFQRGRPHAYAVEAKGTYQAMIDTALAKD